MAKTKNKTRSEVEFLKGEVRRLKKKLKHYEKNGIEIETIDETDENVCPLCARGKIIVVDLKFLTILKCNICSYNEKQRNGKKET